MSELLPREDRIRWILERGARLMEGGAEPVSGLVLPTAKFFPDAFDKSREGVQRLLARVVKLAGLSDLDIDANLVVPDEEAAGPGCSSGACGPGASSAAPMSRVSERDDGWTVNIAANELSNPVVLTTGMVRAVSHIFMREADLYRAFDRRDAEHGIDLSGVWLGFGSILANGAYVYRKG